MVPGGFAGVDVFFVISGYLISSLLLGRLSEGRFSFGKFYARRVRRLLPALVLMLAAVLAIGWYVLLAGEYVAFARHTATSALFANNVALWDEAGYFASASASIPLLHLWSLGVEEQFYLVWPALLLAAWRLPLRVAAVVVAGVAAAFFAAATITKSTGFSFRARRMRVSSWIVAVRLRGDNLRGQSSPKNGRASAAAAVSC